MIDEYRNHAPLESVVANIRGVMMMAFLSQEQISRALGVSAEDAAGLQMRARTDLHRVQIAVDQTKRS